ncbi:HEAT repeat domain-containing protein [Cohnella cholangitidis]|uniref:HEAT repeat domain-containing protein n=1 Tax=Cohnella cholangitidis TaxID=2598458 RepID=UPI0015FDFD9E|nr:HEAT repeat domain-containing protein [Cohnella cholangitidis]
MEVNSKLADELRRFWEWFGTDIHEYEAIKTKNGLEEFMYPHWDELVRLAYRTIEDLEKGEATDVALILEVMALDNEEENILTECVNKLSESRLEIVVKHGTIFPLSNTRWQIAELIGRKQHTTWEKYLLKLIEDSNKYVQRRALLSLVKIDSKLASELSFQKLDDVDEMMRLNAIRIIKETSSTFLNEALKKLEGDTSQLVLEEVASIKKDIDV